MLMLPDALAPPAALKGSHPPKRSDLTGAPRPWRRSDPTRTPPRESAGNSGLRRPGRRRLSRVKGGGPLGRVYSSGLAVAQAGDLAFCPPARPADPGRVPGFAVAAGDPERKPQIARRTLDGALAPLQNGPGGWVGVSGGVGGWGSERVGMGVGGGF